MYATLKWIAKYLVPEKLLYALEPALRALVVPFYSGNNVYCPLCEGRFNRFITLPKTNEGLCPKCGSLPRKRLLWLYVEQELNIHSRSLKVLHFSPGRSLERKLKQLQNINYVTSDFGSSRCEKRHDITAIEEPSGAFDLVICYHVLEHITDDHKAMQELHRVIAPGGMLLVQTPLRQGHTLENPSATTPEERKQLFGQEDHVRHYGIGDLPERLRKAGFEVTAEPFAKRFDAAGQKKMGLRAEELIIVCRKAAST